MMRHAIALCMSFAIAIATALVVVRAGGSSEQDTVRDRSSLPESISARVDKLFAEWDRPDSPGCSVGVSRNGVPAYERGYGMANLELGVAITPASVFHV